MIMSRPPVRARRPSRRIAPGMLRPEDYRLFALATGLGTAMAQAALNIFNRDGHPLGGRGGAGERRTIRGGR